MPDPNLPGGVRFVLVDELPHVPEFLRETPPVSSLLRVDDRVPLMPLIQALAAGGYTLINARNGQLVVMLWPEDFKGKRV